MTNTSNGSARCEIAKGGVGANEKQSKAKDRKSDVLKQNRLKIWHVIQKKESYKSMKTEK